MLKNMMLIEKTSREAQMILCFTASISSRIVQFFTINYVFFTIEKLQQLLQLYRSAQIKSVKHKSFVKSKK